MRSLQNGTRFSTRAIARNGIGGPPLVEPCMIEIEPDLA
jgi:hypothetical protein